MTVDKFHRTLYTALAKAITPLAVVVARIDTHLADAINAPEED